MKKTDWQVDERRLYWELGYRIATARELKGMTQTDLARKVGLSRTSLTNAENGKQRLPLHAVYAVAAALGVRVEKLLPAVGSVNR